MRIETSSDRLGVLRADEGAPRAAFLVAGPSARDCGAAGAPRV